MLFIENFNEKTYNIKWCKKCVLPNTRPNLTILKMAFVVSAHSKRKNKLEIQI